MSRPRRAAAEAASTAIRDTSIAEIDEIANPTEVDVDVDLEEAYLSAPESSNKRKRAKADGPPVEKRRTKADLQTDLLESAVTGRPADQTGSLFRLPPEIRMLILPYLDRSPYSIISLQLTCRWWYLAIAVGVRKDLEWQRRCLAMGAQKKSPGCPTWKETFLAMLNRRCITCLRESVDRIGPILPKEIGPKWTKVCEFCKCRGSHIFRCTTSIKKEGLSEEDQDSLPFKFRKEHNARWVTDYLVYSVEKLKETRRQEQVDEYEEVIADFEGDIHSLRAAIMAVLDGQTSSRLLDRLVHGLVQAEEAPDDDDLQEIVRHWKDLCKAEKQVVTAETAANLAEKWRVPLDSRYDGPKSSGQRVRTWLEAIVAKDITANNFVRFELDRVLHLIRAPNAVVDRYRNKTQACQSKVFCEASPKACSHRKCPLHHNPLCTKDVGELAAALKEDTETCTIDEQERAILAVREAGALVCQGRTAHGKKILEVLQGLLDEASSDCPEASTRVRTALVALPANLAIMKKKDGSAGASWALDKVLRLARGEPDAVDPSKTLDEQLLELSLQNHAISLDDTYRRPGYPFGGGRFTYRYVLQIQKLTVKEFEDYRMTGHWKRAGN